MVPGPGGLLSGVRCRRNAAAEPYRLAPIWFAPIWNPTVDAASESNSVSMSVPRDQGVILPRSPAQLPPAASVGVAFASLAMYDAMAHSDPGVVPAHLAAGERPSLGSLSTLTLP